jgi:signal transduction histidine kinase
VRADPSLRDLRIAEEIESACYYTVAESLANILKHSRATLAEVTLSRDNGCLEIRIDDDGVGFDPGARSGTGLGNLSERLSALGGRLTVTGRPGRGTTVSAKVGLQGPELDE